MIHNILKSFLFCIQNDGSPWKIHLGDTRASRIDTKPLVIVPVIDRFFCHFRTEYSTYLQTMFLNKQNRDACDQTEMRSFQMIAFPKDFLSQYSDHVD